MRILIAEDDVANAKFLSKYLSKFRRGCYYTGWNCSCG